MSEIKPAMTPEEWANPVLVDRFAFVDGRHAYAALALHGEPYGFTWDDVDRLRAAAPPWSDDQDREYDELANLADRIAALLPPREKAG